MAIHGGGGGIAPKPTIFDTALNTAKNAIRTGFNTVTSIPGNAINWVSDTWSGITNSDPVKKTVKTIKKVGTPVLDALMTSAIEADRLAAKEVNDFNAEQAELNRIFQQESAQKAMDFEAKQAELNRTFQQNSAQKAMDFEALWNQKAMDYNERMASTQYQRAVQDLKAAGLSPLLAYANLSGSSPTISTASGQTAAGSMASGRAASGSQASGVKASPSSAKQADLQLLTRLTGVLETGMNSAASMARILAML